MREQIIDYPTTTYAAVSLAEAYGDAELEGWTVAETNPVYGDNLWPTWYATAEEARDAIHAHFDDMEAA
jgi:hypothetical protein